ncbi:MAG TPA: tRNA (adenosine(37)-N6)-threonylcarbamoyltransferase complex ATPase subunit type 1 TsaE [Flavisolibacter sp.]|nr:tRNA (adenosine(37)-N6)-threonylcarbamoyltransferase complex ATPase subunit type 1 TsaE [Flavisolibacter sp.]
MLSPISLDRLENFAEQFWAQAKDKKVFAFHGEMGAGKTTIISALCHYKGTKDVTGSPTFSIINEYSYSENGENKKIFHIDLYRLKDEEEVIQAGVEDCVYSGSVCMVEWPEKAPDLFDEKTVHVFIEPVSETERKVEISLSPA